MAGNFPALSSQQYANHDVAALYFAGVDQGRACFTRTWQNGQYGIGKKV